MFCFALLGSDFFDSQYSLSDYPPALRDGECPLYMAGVFDMWEDHTLPSESAGAAAAAAAAGLELADLGVETGQGVVEGDGQEQNKLWSFSILTMSSKNCSKMHSVHDR